MASLSISTSILIIYELDLKLSYRIIKNHPSLTIVKLENIESGSQGAGRLGQVSCKQGIFFVSRTVTIS